MPADWQSRLLTYNLPTWDVDEFSRQTWEVILDRTYTRPGRVLALIDSIRYIVKARLPGAIVECGVWRGGSMMAAALTLTSEGDHTRDIYLYDTFDGMTAPCSRDIQIRDGALASEMMNHDDSKSSPIWARATLDDVRAGMTSTGYDASHVHYIEGDILNTIPATVPDAISLLRLDTDFYESTVHELEHLYDLIVPGGVLILDDYGWWQGARDAVDEFFHSRKIELLLIRADEGRIAVKPHTPRLLST